MRQRRWMEYLKDYDFESEKDAHLSYDGEGVGVN